MRKVRLSNGNILVTEIDDDEYVAVLAERAEENILEIAGDKAMEARHAERTAIERPRIPRPRK